VTDDKKHDLKYSKPVESVQFVCIGAGGYGQLGEGTRGFFGINVTDLQVSDLAGPFQHTIYQRKLDEQRALIAHAYPARVHVIMCNDSVEAVYVGPEAGAEKLKDSLKSNYYETCKREYGEHYAALRCENLFWRTRDVALFTEVPGGETSQDPAKDVPG
jgi:hypothetical protein